MFFVCLFVCLINGYICPFAYLAVVENTTDLILVPSFMKLNIWETTSLIRVTVFMMHYHYKVS